MANPLRHRVGGAGDRQAAEGMPDQHDIAQFLGLDHVDDVLGESIERDVFGQQVFPLAKPGLGRREHLMPGRAQPVRNPAPAPAAMPGAVNQYERLRRGLRLYYCITRARRQSCNCHCFENIPTFHDDRSPYDS